MPIVWRIYASDETNGQILGETSLGRVILCYHKQVVHLVLAIICKKALKVTGEKVISLSDVK